MLGIDKDSRAACVARRLHLGGGVAFKQRAADDNVASSQCRVGRGRTAKDGCSEGGAALASVADEFAIVHSCAVALAHLQSRRSSCRAGQVAESVVEEGRAQQRGHGWSQIVRYQMNYSSLVDVVLCLRKVVPEHARVHFQARSVHQNLPSRRAVRFELQAALLQGQEKESGVGMHGEEPWRSAANDAGLGRVPASRQQ